MAEHVHEFQPNSSEQFEFLVGIIERLIRGEAHNLMNGHAESTARLILAQLAHVYDVGPLSDQRQAGERLIEAWTAYLSCDELDWQHEQAVNDAAVAFRAALTREDAE